MYVKPRRKPGGACADHGGAFFIICSTNVRLRPTTHRACFRVVPHFSADSRYALLALITRSV